MIKTFTCKKCGATFQKEMKSSYVWYCEDCRKKRNVEINMSVKKRKIPTTEIGVGSGNSAKNKGHYTHGSFKTGIQAYRNIYKDSHKEIKCELCGSKNTYVFITWTTIDITMLFLIYNVYVKVAIKNITLKGTRKDNLRRSKTV